jgi:hypothetical protein
MAQDESMNLYLSIIFFGELILKMRPLMLLVI